MHAHATALGNALAPVPPRRSPSTVLGEGTESPKNHYK